MHPVLQRVGRQKHVTEHLELLLLAAQEKRPAEWGTSRDADCLFAAIPLGVNLLVVWGAYQKVRKVQVGRTESFL